MIGILAALCIGYPPASDELSILPASKFKPGQEYVWVQEVDSSLISFGGNKKREQERRITKLRIIEIREALTDDLTHNPSKAPISVITYKGSAMGKDAPTEEETRRKLVKILGDLRVAQWSELDAYNEEPSFVRWLYGDFSGLSQYTAAREAYDFINDFGHGPTFSLTPISLLGIRKPGDAVEFRAHNARGMDGLVKLQATRVTVIDTHKCLEVSSPMHTAYYRLSDGLLQRVKERTGPEHEFEIDQVKGKGTVTTRGYRLEKLPPKG